MGILVFAEGLALGSELEGFVGGGVDVLAGVLCAVTVTALGAW